MKLLLANAAKIKPRNLPRAGGTNAQFVKRFTKLPASAYYITDEGAAQTLLQPTAGQQPFQVFIPSAAALAARGWTGLPYRVLIDLHGDGYKGVDGGTHMQEWIPQLLGWGGAQDGSLNSPNAVWPLLTVFPQRPSQWTGDPTTDNGGRGRRVMYQNIDACLAQVRAEFNIDNSRIYLTGFSGGGFIANQYVQQRVNRGLPRNIAALLSVSSCFGYNMVEGVPGLVISPATEQQAATVEAPVMVASGVPWRHYNGSADSIVQPSWYQYTAPAMAAAGATAPNYQAFIVSGGDHLSTRSIFGSNADVTADPWSWLLGYHL